LPLQLSSTLPNYQSVRRGRIGERAGSSVPRMESWTQWNLHIYPTTPIDQINRRLRDQNWPFRLNKPPHNNSPSKPATRATLACGFRRPPPGKGSFNSNHPRWRLKKKGEQQMGSLAGIGGFFPDISFPNFWGGPNEPQRLVPPLAPAHPL